MSGETNLATLLKTMKPELNPGEYVFCTIENSSIRTNQAICVFREKEGLTIVLEKSVADAHQLEYNVIFAWITLTVHSSLEAVGLTAAFSTALAEANISCNVIAGFYHDHIFVLKKDAERAVEVLKCLSV